MLKRIRNITLRVMMRMRLKKLFSAFIFWLPYRRNGIAVKLPIVGGLGFSHLFNSEPWMRELIGKLLAYSPGTFIDVGTNIGQTLLNLKAVNPECRYIGFEPNPACVLYINRLIELNDFKRCSVVPVGLSESSGLVSLSLFSANEAGSGASMVSGVHAKKGIVRSRIVPVLRFESIHGVVDCGDISVIKIDVEGAELEVLKGLVDEIERSKPVIIIEILPVPESGKDSLNARNEEVQAMIKRFGYALLRVNKTQDGGLLHLEAIEKIHRQSGANMRDYVCLPKESPLLTKTGELFSRVK